MCISIYLCIIHSPIENHCENENGKQARVAALLKSIQAISHTKAQVNIRLLSIYQHVYTVMAMLLTVRYYSLL